MNCNLSEKVSLFVDHALTTEEADEMKKHLEVCLECRQAEQDFLRFRRQIKLYAAEADPFAERQALWRILTSQKTPLWRRRVALPVPVVAIAFAIVLVLSAWSILFRGARIPVPVDRVRSTTVDSEAGKSNEAGIDLSRFDHGQRAMIYKVRRAAK